MAGPSLNPRIGLYHPPMPIYRLGDLIPAVHEHAYVHPEAVLIGEVTVGPEATVWPCAVLRGDFGSITVGARSSIQDGTVIHAGPGFPTMVGEGCVIGHLAHLEGCLIEDDTLVGSGSVVLHHAVVRSGATVAANAVVPNRMEVPPGALALGVPAEIRPGGSNLDVIRIAAAEYAANGRRYRESLRPVD